MPYIPALSRDAVAPAIGATLDAVQVQLGVLPNMFRTLAHTPVALNGYMQLSGATARGKLNAKQREQIALVVAETNDCGYCIAAHGAIGKLVGLSDAQVMLARNGEADSPRDAAVLTLARRIVETRGRVPEAELEVFKAAGFDDSAILEVLTNVVLNIFTNYTNHIAGTEIDFPVVPRAAA